MGIIKTKVSFDSIYFGLKQIYNMLQFKYNKMKDTFDIMVVFKKQLLYN